VPAFNTTSLPSEFDWRAKSDTVYVSDVKRSVTSAPSWAYAVADSIESALAIKYKQQIPLSVQHLIDCSPQSVNTSSGAYAYILEAGGLATEAYYPTNGKQS
jgi:predicted alpha/beta hydrolase family esterase